MELSVTNMFIYNPQFLGVMRTAVVKEYHDIRLKLEFYKILSTDRQLVEMVERNCREDHTNADTLKLISNETIYSKSLTYIESEEFLNYLNFINTRNVSEDEKNNKIWLVDFKFSKDVNFFKITMSTRQIYRLWSQVFSFYTHYVTLSAISRQHLLQEKQKVEKQEKKITEYINGNEKSSERVQVVSPQDIITRERSELDDIFELCLTPSIKSSLIHYAFSYFRYLTNKHCVIKTNDKNQVQYNLPLLMPGKLSIDEQYFSSLILSNNSVPSNNITFAIKKILNNLYTNKEKYKSNPLLTLMICYLLFIYMLRYMYDSNRDTFRNYFKQFICNPEAQYQLFKTLIDRGFSEFSDKIFFKIYNINLNDLDENYNLETINKLSEEYKHLIPVSQKEFADRIFDMSDKEDRNVPIDFKLSCKKVIDISKLMEIGQKQTRVTTSVMFDPDHTLEQSQEATRDYEFLNYQLQSNNGSKVITKAYGHLLNYVKNPSSVLLLKENDLPKEVVNLFDTLSKKVLNISRITKDNISVFSYYKLLLENLPDPKKFRHVTLLYIIYQIMLPFSYDIHGNSQFEDCFL